MNNIIEVKNLKKYYKLGGETVKAIDNVSFEIEKGKLVAIIGASGSGKSTLMHILGGLDRADSGSVKVNGKDIANLNSKKLAKYRNKEIGFVFQSFNLQNNLTALENVMLPLQFGSKKGDRKKLATEALSKLGLLDRINHKPTELSGGQRQRVSIARAIVNKPSIIFADEPTGNLDSKTGKIVIEIFKKLIKDGVTIVVVTHDQDIAKQCDQTIKMQDGKII